MTLFTYSGTGSDGREQQGTIDSPDRASAERGISLRGVIHPSIVEATEQERADSVLHDASQRRAASVLRGWEVTPSSPASTGGPHSSTHGAPAETVYVPLLNTVRLYAGWLLAWYTLVFALGAYQATKSLPFDFPLVYGLAQSPLVLSFAFATFLFLLFSTIVRAIGSGLVLNIIIAIVWATSVYAFRVNL